MKNASTKRVRESIKNELTTRARMGDFNGNPLLTVPHQMTCPKCGNKHEITYIHFLKSGLFKLGKTKLVEVSYAAPTILGLSYSQEQITPIVLLVNCSKCQTEFSCTPTNVEYLLFTTARKQKLRNLYV